MPACGIRLVIMTGRKTHLFLHSGGLFDLADKGITRSRNRKLDKFNLEIRHGFLAARKIKVWNSLREEMVELPLLGV